nr:hypothetical protein Iba_chr01bCG0900 [Ipomoea batatas]
MNPMRSGERIDEAKPNLDIKLDEISQVISRGIEREDGVLLEGIHSPIRRLQYIHSVPSVSDHHKFRWPQTAASPHFHPCRNHQFNPSPFTHESESKQRSQKRTHSPWGKRVEQREAFSGTCPPTLGMPMPAIWAALRAIIYCSNCRRRNDRTQREEKGLRTKEHRTWECRLNTRWKTVNGHFDGIFSPVTRIHVVDRIGKEVGHDDVEMRRRKNSKQSSPTNRTQRQPLREGARVGKQKRNSVARVRTYTHSEMMPNMLAGAIWRPGCMTQLLSVVLQERGMTGLRERRKAQEPRPKDIDRGDAGLNPLENLNAF